MTQSVLNGFLIFNIIQTLIFSGLLATKRNRTSADFIMILLLLLFACHSLLILMNYNVTHFTFFRILSINLTLLYGPLLLFYVKILWTTNIDFKFKLFIHTIPFYVFLFLTFIFFDHRTYDRILSMLGAVSGLGYCVLTLAYVRQYEKRIINLYSTTKGVSLDWLNRLIISVIVIWVIIFILIVMKQIFDIYINLYWFFILIPFFISYIGYYALKQMITIQNNSTPILLANEINDTNPTAIKQRSSYKKSGLSEQDMKKIFRTLENVMKTEKVYLNPNLNLRDLANKTQIPQHHITQTLNSFVKKNFYDYINNYRVEEYIERLKNDDGNNFSLLGIALDCGFNSKSTFNRTFKKVTGFPPSEYKNKLL